MPQARDTDIVIRRAVPRLTIEEMFRGKSRQEWRKEYAPDYDWVAEAGREIVDE